MTDGPVQRDAKIARAVLPILYGVLVAAHLWAFLAHRTYYPVHDYRPFAGGSYIGQGKKFRFPALYAETRSGKLIKLDEMTWIGTFPSGPCEISATIFRMSSGTPEQRERVQTSLRQVLATVKKHQPPGFSEEIVGIRVALDIKTFREPYSAKDWLTPDSVDLVARLETP